MPEETLSFPAAEHIRNKVMTYSEDKSTGVMFNGKNVKRIDVTVAKVSRLIEFVSHGGLLEINRMDGTHGNRIIHVFDRHEYSLHFRSRISSF